jgi:hypothetical protein
VISVNVRSSAAIFSGPLYVARHARGPLADAIPDGFEIYESSKGRVSLRRILPTVISDKELIFVEQELATRPVLARPQSD